MSSEDYTMPENLTGLVIVASTRAARGVYEDKYCRVLQHPGG